jgi:hypothetical protein
MNAARRSKAHSLIKRKKEIKKLGNGDAALPEVMRTEKAA